MASATSPDCDRADKIIMRSAMVVLTLLAGISVDGSKQQTLEQLIARAPSARAEDQPHLYIEIARKELEAAEKSYRRARTMPRGNRWTSSWATPGKPATPRVR